MKIAIIVCGGYTNTSFGLNYIHQIKPQLLIAADSGLHFFYEAKLLPDLIIGDFDSAKEEELIYFQKQGQVKIKKLPPEKDETDTEAAIFAAIEEECTQIILLGSTGSRVDHLLGNIQLLGLGLTHHISLCMVDEHNRIQMIDHELELKKQEQFGNYVSLIPILQNVTGVTLKGMKYPLTDAILPAFRSLGISNEILEETAKISIKSGVLLVIESRD